MCNSHTMERLHRPLRSVLETNRIKPRPVIWTLLMKRRSKRINWLATRDEERRTNRFYAKLHRDRDDMAEELGISRISIVSWPPRQVLWLRMTKSTTE